MKTLIKNVKIVNEGKIFEGDILIENDLISKIDSQISEDADQIIDGGKISFTGVIDDQVHFREPGLTHKGDIETESEQPLQEEQPVLSNSQYCSECGRNYWLINMKLPQKSYANYGFMMGGTNDNLEEVLKTNPRNVPGIKLFLGSSTGNMLVDNPETLENIFSNTKMLIAVHCEDEATIRANTQKYLDEYGEDIPVKFHHLIRSEEACYKSSSKID
jgi:dihydroorotase